MQEGLLHRMELAVARQSFDRGDGAVRGAIGGKQTRVYWIAVDQHGAGAAIAGVAAFLHAETSEIAQKCAQALSGPRFGGVALSVDQKGHGAPAPFPASSLRISSANCRVTCRRHCRRAVDIVVVKLLRNFRFEFRVKCGARWNAGKRQADRTRRCGGHGQCERAVVRGQRADQECAGAAKRAQRDLTECGAPAKRRQRQVDSAKQFARLERVAQRRQHEIAHGDLALAALRRPDRAHAVERRGERDHRSRRQRHAEIAADGRHVPDFERREKRPAALIDQRGRGPIGRERHALQFGDLAGRGHRRPCSVISSDGQPRSEMSISRLTRSCGSENNQVPPASHASPALQVGNSARRRGLAISVMVLRSIASRNAARFMPCQTPRHRRANPPVSTTFPAAEAERRLPLSVLNHWQIACLGCLRCAQMPCC